MLEIEWLASFGPTHDDACIPWRESRIVDQRLQFLSSNQKEEMSVTDLCHEYGVSRPTAYKWIKSHNELGPEGLLDQARSRIFSQNLCWELGTKRRCCTM
jgi:hypothetical protein